MTDNTSSVSNTDAIDVKMQQSRRKINIIIALVSMIAAGVLYFYLVPKYIGSSTGKGLSPEFFPKLWAILIFLVAFIQLLVILLKPESNECDGDLEEWPAERKKRGLFAIGFVVLYVFVLIETLGYFIATTLVLAISFLLLGERSPLKIILASIVFTLTVYILFEIALNIYLPRGILWQ